MRECMTWATTPGYVKLAFKKNDVLPLSLPTTKVEGLSYARTCHGLPNFGLGAAGAQMILALQVLLNYDLSPYDHSTYMHYDHSTCMYDGDMS